MGKLGETLKARRMELGLSLEQAQEATRIRAKILEHIEAGDYNRLPNPGYVRGYISSYARFLELDSIPLLNMYKAETGAGSEHPRRLNLPQSDEAVVPTGEQHAVPWRAAVAIALAVIVLSLAIWGVTRLFSHGGGDEKLPDPPPVTEPTTETAPPSTEPTPTTTPETQTAPPQESDVSENQPFTLTVKVADRGASWFRIMVDGKPAYEGVLTSGQEKKFEVTEKASVRAGKPEVATVLRNGQPVSLKNVNNLGEVELSAAPSGQ